ncbi:uncharacterized protein LOC125239779 [Leguminivora glycinivorella]|uniref:uncharacterized protein LOC125239779 n=1 Tax=Leguminivora glycinivorella TaxID=1035111 RepID=UPI00200D01EE|nr:uncharacterized protein LOC125239779 [Leguminivora glycinivorella]
MPSQTVIQEDKPNEPEFVTVEVDPYIYPGDKFEELKQEPVWDQDELKDYVEPEISIELLPGRVTDNRQWKRYSQEDLDKAIEDVKKGSPIARAARKYGIPRITLSNKVNGKTARNCRMGPKTFVPEDIEKGLVKWIQDMQNAGLPVIKEQLLDTVQTIVKDKKIITPFKNNRPGRHWLESFMKRHPELSIKFSQSRTISRVAKNRKTKKKLK